MFFGIDDEQMASSQCEDLRWRYFSQEKKSSEKHQLWIMFFHFLDKYD